MTKGAIGNLINRYQAVLKKCRLLNTFGTLTIASMMVMGTGMAEAKTYTSNIEEYWGYIGDNVPSYEDYEDIRKQDGKNTIYTFSDGDKILYSVDGSSTPADVAIYINSFSNVSSSIFPTDMRFTIKGDLDIITDDNDATPAERASTVGIVFNAGESFLTGEDEISITTHSLAVDNEAYSVGVSIGNLGSSGSDSGNSPAIGNNTVSFNKLDIDLTATTQNGESARAYGVEMRGNSNITIADLKVSATAGGGTGDESNPGNDAEGILATGQYGLSGGAITVERADITAKIEGPGNAFGVSSFEPIESGYELAESTIHIKEGSIVAESLDERGNTYGVFASGKSRTITLGSDTATSISVKAQGGSSNYALYSFDGTITAEANRVDLSADNIIYADGGSISVTSLKEGTLDGNVETAFEGAKASLDLRGNTHWTGMTFREEDSDITLALKDAAQWSMTADSTLSSLDMHGGIVDLAHNASTRTSKFRTLTADALTGEGGIFRVNADIKNDETDQVIIGKGSGTHQIEVMPTGTGADREAMDTFIVRQHEGDASFSLANKDGKVEQGLYFYELADRTGVDGQEWYLKRATSGSTPETPTGETEASLSGLAGHYAMWYGQLTDLRKRMGEVRYGTQTGLWVRGFADKTRLDGFAGAGFTQNLVGGSIGYDWLASAGDDAQWILGMQIRSGHADQDVTGRHGGYGDLSSVGGGLYATWVHADGWYVDAVATMDWYEHEIRTAMTDGTRVHDDRSSWGVGLSIEGGRRFDFAADESGSWFVEPQLELSWFYVDGGSFTASNGMAVDQDNMHSLTGRAGAVLGRKFVLDGGNGTRYVQPYVKAGLVQEFLGEQKARFNGESFTSDLDGTRVYYGLGVDWQAADNMRLYLQAEREEGEHFTREYNVSAGLKFSF